MSRRALVLGAGSAIARALVQRLALEGYDFVLAARNCARLEPFAADLQVRLGRRADLLEFDALDFAAMATLPGRVHDQFGDFELVVQVFGTMEDHRQTTGDTERMLRVLNTNFTAAAVVLSHLANYLLERGAPGGIIGVSSVAGDRGRQSNYFYGAAKGGLSLFLQGLRNRLAATPVHVMTVKPGFVDTPMTEGLEGLFLVASPERVAGDIVRAYRKKRDVLYTPFFWRYILLLIRLVPERLFKRLKL